MLMINTPQFGGALKNEGFNFFSGVPCSYLKYFINYALNECDYVMAANEGDAAAVCAGAYMGGRLPVFICQNSGLTNAVSPLTSLNYIFRIPLLGFVSLRGASGCPDEPQHELMGEITGGLLDLMKIKWDYLSGEETLWRKQLLNAAETVKSGETYFFVVKKNTFGEVKLKEKSRPASNLSKNILIGQTGAACEDNKDETLYAARIEALKTIAGRCGPETLLIATTGMTGRELYDLGDRANNFYMVGSMGCAGSIGLGLALCRPERKIAVIDGDGALLMRMGSMATAGYYSPGNMLHVLLDNRSHASTGGQFTVSPSVNFAAAAHSCGYKRSITAENIESLAKRIEEWKRSPELTFIHLRISESVAAEAGRPAIKPFEVKERLMKFLSGGF
ncbi:MAG: hypothetical protein BWY32_02631 [bacterium ADurb.Bin243]|nr:MAG: hypothetical protein BWY32_02631 [bacterium ADurb.Bin243]